ncbi:MAG: aromatic aminobenezylarsenical efflux permease ArsG family transporter [Elusimicrobiota bacterium]
MNFEFLAVSLTAIWTGILTAISPCPLGTNIAALSYISKHCALGKSTVLFHSLLYTAGRAVAYIVIGFLVVKGLLYTPSFSFLIQKYGNQILSPLLVLAGMYMLDMFSTNFEGFNILNPLRFKTKTGTIPSLFMGIVFAMAFCPISAALYFGIIIPLAVTNSSPFFIPFLYGIGTALPVTVVAIVIDFGIKKISSITEIAARVEKYAKAVTGWIFIIAGIYLALKYIFEIV